MDMPARMSGDMPDRMPDRMSEDMPDRMSEDIPDRMPDRMSEDMPDRMSEDMPGRMSEDMPDGLPDGYARLNVRWYELNVMVGITRSKVIFVSCVTKKQRGMVVSTCLNCFNPSQSGVVILDHLCFQTKHLGNGGYLPYGFCPNHRT